MSKTKTEVATIEETTAVAVVDESQFAVTDQAGFDNTDASDAVVPSIRVMQDLSPEVKERGDVKPGMLLHTSDIENPIDGNVGALIIPCYHHKCFTHWLKRREGGGKIGEYDFNHPFIVDHFNEKGERPWGKFEVNSGKEEVIETHHLYLVMITADGDPLPARMSLQSTATPAWRDLNTKVQSFRVSVGQRRVAVALTTQLFNLTTLEKKDGQDSWYVPHFKREIDHPDSINAIGKGTVLAKTHPWAIVAEDFASQIRSLHTLGQVINEEGEIPFD